MGYIFHMSLQRSPVRSGQDRSGYVNPALQFPKSGISLRRLSLSKNARPEYNLQIRPPSRRFLLSKARNRNQTIRSDLI
jgi:hypothetical protein